MLEATKMVGGGIGEESQPQRPTPIFTSITLSWEVPRLEATANLSQPTRSSGKQ